jgi:hypothetical protein
MKHLQLLERNDMEMAGSGAISNSSKTCKNHSFHYKKLVNA